MKRSAVIGIVAGVAVLAVAGVAAAWALTRPASPEATAESYLRALSDGDFTAIEPLLDDAVDADPLRAAFSGATGFIEDYSFTVTAESAGATGVRADATLGGDPVVIGFLLAPHDGGYVLADHLGSLTPTTTMGASVQVGDLVVPTGDAVALLPAVYPVSAAPAGILSGRTDVVVGNDAPVAATVDAALAPDAAALAQEQVDAYAQTCAAVTDEVPAHCGIRIPWAADLATFDGVAFRIDRMPVVELSADARTFAATEGDLVATVSGTDRSGAPASFTYRAEDWALRGSVRFEDDGMVLLAD